jgi:membrane fusion protein (multidrug efflux system)
MRPVAIRRRGCYAAGVNRSPIAFRGCRSRVAASLIALLLLLATPAFAQFGPQGPPAVGVVKVVEKPIIDSNQFVGRIQAVNRVDLVARVTAFLDQLLFTEGAEVKQGQLLYKLESGPFEADLASKTAAVAQQRALVRNASITLGRAQSLINTPAGQRSTLDDALAQQASQAAQLAGAEAQQRASQINLDYTQIHAPVDGKITRTSVTVGNVVGPTTGTLATIVSQDPMYVVFPVSVRTAIDLRARYADKGGLNAVTVKLVLPDGTPYGQTGKLDYVDPTIAQNTDTLLLRGVMPNPLLAGAKLGQVGNRALVDGEFVTAILQAVEPVEAMAIPRAAVLDDQQGSYVYVVGADDKAEQRRITLGQSTPETAVVLTGLKPGETVIAEGLQRVMRPGIVVKPGPVSPQPTAPAKG